MTAANNATTYSLKYLIDVFSFIVNARRGIDGALNRFGGNKVVCSQ